MIEETCGDIEDVGFGPTGNIGPIVRRVYKPEYVFHIHFTESNKKWLENPLLAEVDKTVGELNREYLHMTLDKHLDDFLAGTRTP